MMNRGLVVACLLVLLLVVTATGILATTRTERHYERVGGRGGIHFVWIDGAFAGDPAVYEDAIADMSRGEVCQILFYSDREPESAGTSPDDAQIAAWLAKYELDRPRRLESFMFVAQRAAGRTRRTNTVGRAETGFRGDVVGPAVTASSAGDLLKTTGMRVVASILSEENRHWHVKNGRRARVFRWLGDARPAQRRNRAGKGAQWARLVPSVVALGADRHARSGDHREDTRSAGRLDRLARDCRSPSWGAGRRINENLAGTSQSLHMHRHNDVRSHATRLIPQTPSGCHFSQRRIDALTYRASMRLFCALGGFLSHRHGWRGRQAAAPVCQGKRPRPGAPVSLLRRVHVVVALAVSAALPVCPISAVASEANR